MKKHLFLTLLLCLAGFGAFSQIWQNNHVITHLPYTPCVGSPVMFYAVDTSGNFQHSYHWWSFGDGGSSGSNSQNPFATHIYSSPGTYWVNFGAWDSVSMQMDSVYLQITIDSICTNHDMFSGVTYDDVNGNGAQDVGEPNLGNQIININPGNFYMTSDLNGNWMVNLPTGSYTFSCVPATYHQVTEPSGNSYSLTSAGNGSVHSGNNFGIAAIPGMNDLRVYYSAIPPVPGFTRTYTLHYANVGTTTQNATITFDHTPSLVFVGASNSGTHAGSTVTWSIPNLAPGASGMVSCQLQIPQNIQVGSNVGFTATINPIVGDQAPGDNMDSRDHVVLSSYDPNDKSVVPAGQNNTGDITPGTRLTYTIRFQNTGNFYATDVILHDTLDADLDQSTLEVIGGSHPFTWHNDFGKVAFEFRNIMLPDSNTNEPGSHGHVTYRISHKAGLPLGTDITNTAYIYFDFNAAIVTNTTLNTLANVVAIDPFHKDIQMSVAPNPFRGETLIRFNNPSSLTHQVTLRDVTGRVVFQRDGIMGEQVTIDGGSLPAGMYLLSLENANGLMGVSRLIRE
ncbi:MAG: T9SS type A sorting domain-containing protein [Bacteroidia bacterium]